MKKLILASTFVLGAAVSGIASAATTFENVAFAIPLGATPSAEAAAATNAECALLSDEVKLTVSANVVGGFACNETNNLMQVAACHAGGSRATGVSCSSDADLSTPEVELPAGCDDTSGNSTIPSFKAFSASSAGGVMSEVSLDQRCTPAQMAGITWVD